MTTFIPSLQDLSYAVLVRHIGTPVLNVKTDKSYKMIEKDGVNYLDLGRCINVFSIYPSWLNDGIGQIHLTFEKNNDHPHLFTHFYGNSVYSDFVNVIEYE